ncbi:MAG: wax ester/triacylglycerol synthase domain-containing protein [Rhodococcus sp. (in: high G+C Gram-positive bacteria)]|uniref:wax ester/triacylglycerol synthase domain-containing protein n=1 Tax=Rhodococcus sp. TaxID=1831 RepID=UPI003BB73640
MTSQLTTTSQVRPVDASYVLDADHGHHLDPLQFWVFDSASETPPTTEEINDHFRDRMPIFAELNRRYVEVPAHLDHAYWAADDLPIDKRIVHDDRVGLDWPAMLDVLGELAGAPLDARTTAWRIDVFHGVREVPGATATATVLTLRGNHSLISGPLVLSLWEAFFGAGTEPVHFPGLGPVTPHVNRALAAARGIARIPRSYVRYLRTIRAAVRDAENTKSVESQNVESQNSAPAPDLTSTGINRDPGDRRSVLALRLGSVGPLPKGFTVTALALTTISVALQRYLAETDGQCPPDLTALATVAVGAAPESLGINRIGWTDVALRPDVTSIPERAAAVQGSLTTGRAAATAGTLRRLTFAADLPSFMLPAELATNRRLLRARTSPRTHTALTSIRITGTTEWTLAGRPLLFGAGCPPLTSEVSVIHGLFGLGDDLTLAVITSPDVMPDTQRYATLLTEALAEVTAALRPA